MPTSFPVLAESHMLADELLQPCRSKHSDVLEWLCFLQAHADMFQKYMYGEAPNAYISPDDAKTIQLTALRLGSFEMYILLCIMPPPGQKGKIWNQRGWGGGGGAGSSPPPAVC